MLDKKPLLHESLLPEMRSRWLLFQGAKATAEAAIKVANEFEGQYKDMLDTALKVGGYDPGMQWRVNLTTGEVEEAQGATAGGSLPVS